MTILEMSLGGAVLIAAILVLRRALLYRIPKWAFLLLWAVALGRLLIPFALPSRFSVYTGAAQVVQLFEQDAPAMLSMERPPVTDPGIFQGDSWTAPAIPADPVPAQAPDASDPAATLQPAPAPEPAAKPAAPAVEPVEVEPGPVQSELAALENRWGIPDGEIPEGSEFTAAGFEDAKELGKYLETVHGLYPGDYTADRAGGTVSVHVHYREKLLHERLLAGTYPVNSRGESYGSISDYEVVGYKPDLISVVATNGATGYVLRSDMENTGYPGPMETPEDMAAYTEWLEAQPGPRLIPVYDVNRDNIVGDFSIGH